MERKDNARRGKKIFTYLAPSIFLRKTEEKNYDELFMPRRKQLLSLDTYNITRNVLRRRLPRRYSR